jgi:carbon monoxide dehydrogenase subunit G
VQIHGSSLVRAQRARVWTLLNDPDVLARCTPGLSRLVPDGEDRFAATFSIALGPVKGSFPSRAASPSSTRFPRKR